ncbi:Cysteine-rich receptor-like protein kinase 10 [Hordeum vulgare]|nr:Cysteine-rich receptor-like protein kinase 10 [Hordeum vulgare]
MEHQRRALGKIAARSRDRKEDGVDILDDCDKEAPEPSNRDRHGDPRQGCTKDGGGAQDDEGDDDGNDDGDYSNLYKLLGMYMRL